MRPIVVIHSFGFDEPFIYIYALYIRSNELGAAKLTSSSPLAQKETIMSVIKQMLFGLMEQDRFMALATRGHQFSQEEEEEIAADHIQGEVDDQLREDMEVLEDEEDDENE